MANMSAMTVNTPFARNFSRSVLCLSHGKGVHLWDSNGNRYLDFGSGIAVNALGYGERRLAAIVAQQMRRLVHTSNLFTTPQSLHYGELLLDHARTAGRAPFAAVQLGNSGSEANEAAIKYARLYARARRGAGHHKILSFEHAFHGRTMGALSATPKPAYRTKFEPLVPGFETIPFNDLRALESTLDDSFAAVIVEAIQGEGGLEVVRADFAEALNRLTAQLDVLLIVDEVQTGLGRTGQLFASPLVGLKPDIITLSKPIAGGLPLGATLIPPYVNDLVEVGDHGTTFGGGPVTTAAATYVLERLTEPDFLPRVRERAAQLQAGLEELATRFDSIVELRGAGLLRGVAVDFGSAQEKLFGALGDTARDLGLLVLRSGSNVVRIAPPLIISERELEAGLRLLARTFEALEAQRPA